MKITKLDLGGTSQFLTKDAVSLSIDGTKMCEEDDLSLVVIGDYNRPPFKSETFKTIKGCCYIEGPVDPFELARVAKPKAKLWIRGCGPADLEVKCVATLLWRAGFRITKMSLPVYSEDMGWEWDEGISAVKEA